MSERSVLGRPVVVGDAAVGELPNGVRVVGGSALNIAVHLHELGLAPLLITRVGEDDDGERVVNALRDNSVDLRGVQVDSESPTGQVRVRVRSGQPVVEIRGQQAYERIDPTAAAAVIADADGELLVHSTVLARNKQSWDALQRLRAVAALPVFLDLDGSSPWCRDEVIRSSLLGTRWLKLADRDLGAVASGLGLEPGACDVETTRAILARCALDAVLVTYGDRQVVVDARKTAEVQPRRGGMMTDAGRVGDAMTAGAVAGVLRGVPVIEVARVSMSVAEELCSESPYDLAKSVREMEFVSLDAEITETAFR